MLSYSQVSFSKFKFKKDSPFGCCPGRKMTDVKFKITSDKAIKYVRVYYYGVNQVGDAVSSDIVGAVNANVEHTKHRMIFLLDRLKLIKHILGGQVVLLFIH